MENDQEVIEPTIDIELEADPAQLQAELAEARKAIKTAEAQKNHWKSKALGKGEEKAAQPESQTDEWKERMELKIEGYTEDEVKFIQRNGGKAALADDFVKSAIEKRREQQRSEKAAVDDASVGKSEIERKFTEAQLKAMPLDEMEKHLTQK